MEQQFPRTAVGGLSLPRMIIGTNWVLGYSHRTESDSFHILDYHKEAETTAKLFEAYLQYGINAVLGPMFGNYATKILGGVEDDQPNIVVRAAKLAEDRTGKELILIPTTDLNTDDTPEGRRAAASQVKTAKELGAKVCYISNTTIDQLLNVKEYKIDRLEDYTYMIREAGMIPMIGNHNYVVIPITDLNGYDVELYLTPYNLAGFYMQVEVETIYRAIHNAKKPVLTIKAFAAGRVTPLAALNFNYSTIRPQDMLAVGAFTPAEVHEDVEIALATIEHRPVPSLSAESPMMKRTREMMQAKGK